MIKTIIKANNYMDSIFLMKATKEVMKVEGVKDAVVVMGSDMNKTVLADFGGLTDEVKAATPNDLIISVDSDDESAAENAATAVMALLTGKDKGSEAGTVETVYTSLPQAIDAMSDANLAIISLPGDFAAMEAKYALQHNMNVFIFSDLTVEEEVMLKKLGAEKNLLVMGPGAGTAVIDGVSIGLMSKLRRGNIGIVAASGSGLQEVAILVHRAGLGISQAIGTGGRDLSQAVGGSMMLRSMDLLKNDPDTDVIVLVSKPPFPDTTTKIFNKIKEISKPVVVFFLGGDPKQIREAGAYAPATLEEAAIMACALAKGEQVVDTDYVADCKAELMALAQEEKKKLAAGQKYFRGLFCGGTHSEEAVTLLQSFVSHMHSNIKFGKVDLLENRHVSLENTLVDMGDEEFTKGRPHPVMDPTILIDRLLQEGRDPEVGVILFDLIIGHACHEDPVGCIEETIAQINREAEAEGRYISFVSSICGTDLDPQNMADQVRRLEKLGVHVLPSNGRAALLAGLIVC